MKLRLLTALLLASGLCVVNGAAYAQAAPATASKPVTDETTASKLKTRKELISYSIGVTTARNLIKDGVELDADLVTQGIKDAMAGGRLQVNEKELRSVMSGFLGEMRQKMASNRKEAEQINKKKGDEFLATNSKKEGVVVLPNGLQYRVLKAGSGAKPSDSDTVLTSYRGALLTGFEFDGTEEGKPATLKMGNLIPGWKEALKLMPTGSHWQIFIPPNLAYGTRGVGSDIGPNEVLVFDVTLVAVK